MKQRNRSQHERVRGKTIPLHRHSPRDHASDGDVDVFGQHTTALAIVVSVIAGIVYLATVARDVVVGDTGEFLSAAATLGVAHPPGYPLLVLLGHVFSFIPGLPLPLRMNLVAVVCGAMTVGLTFSIARRLGARTWPAMIAAVALAFNPLFWEWSLALEAFALNNLLVSALIYFLVRWDAEPARWLFLVAAAFCSGLGAANHLTIILLIPFVLVVMWRRRANVTAGALAACVAAAVVGLLPYLYIPWAASREPFVNWGSISSAGGVLRHFLRSDYGTGSLVAAGSSPGSPFERLVGFGASFSALEGVLLMFGVAGAYRRTRWYLWAALLSFALAGPAFVAYANMDVSIRPLLWALRRFFLMPHVIVAPLVAFGVTQLADVIAARIAHSPRAYAERAVTIAAAAFITMTAVQAYPHVDQSRNHLAHSFALDLLKTLEPNTVLFGLGDEVVFPVAYVQAVEKERPDVTLVMLGLFRSYPWYLAQLRRRQLNVPFDRYDPRNPATSLRALVDANPSRPFATAGTLTDNSLASAYWLRRRGLVEQIEPMAKDVGLESAVRENDSLLKSYRLPDPTTVRRNTFEIAILAKYEAVPMSMAKQFELAGLNREAEGWYRRAATIDPSAPDARQALERLGARPLP